jgi:hypothetical protein
VADVKGRCLLVLKVFLYTCGAAIGGLCVAFGIGLLLAGPASAATQPSPGGLLGSAVQTVSATVTTTTQAATSALPAATSAATGVVTTAQTATSGITNTLTSTATGVVTPAGTPAASVAGAGSTASQLVSTVSGAAGSATGQFVPTVTAAAGSTAGHLVSTVTDAAGSAVNQLVSTVTTLTSAPRPGSGGPAPAPPSGTGGTGGSGSTGGSGGTGGLGSTSGTGSTLWPSSPGMVVPPRTPQCVGTQNPGSGHLGSGSAATARPSTTSQAATGRDVSQVAGVESTQRAGTQPALPVSPPLPAGMPDGPAIVPGSGSGSGSGTAGVALLICACLLVLGSARRGNKADAPSTSAILRPDEVPG